MSDKNSGITEIQLLRDVSDKSDEQLSTFISELGLSCSPLFLREVYKCLSAEAIAPSCELLRFFDAIFCASLTDPKNIELSEISAEDKEVMLTFLDVCQKAEYVRKNSAFSLSDIFDISSEYLSTLDVKAPQTVCEGEDICIYSEGGNELLRLGFSKATPLRYGYVDKNEKNTSAEKPQSIGYLAEDTDIFLVSAKNEDYNRLQESRGFSELLKADQKTDKKGLLYAIIQLCNGASIDISALSRDGEDCELSSLVNAFGGEHVVAASKEDRDALTSIAEEYGVKITKIATSQNIPMVKIGKPDGEITIRAGFLRRIFSFGEKLYAKTAHGQIAPTEYENLFYTVLGEKDKRGLCEAVKVKNHTVASRYTSHISFGDGINAVLDTLFALLAKGADRRKTGINIKIGVRRENVSGGVSALLGAYRAIMELCLPQINSEFIFSDDEYILCTAFAPKNEGKITSQDLSFDEKPLYLLSFKRFDNSLPPYMPVFEELREMCDYLYTAINDGTVLSARAVDGKVYSALHDVQIIPLLSDGINENTSAQGFVVELSPGSKIKAPLIGILKNGNCENKTSEENKTL